MAGVAPRLLAASPAPARSERAVIGFLAFLGVLLAFGIDVSLPAFDQIRAEFDLDAKGISPAVVGTAYFAGMAVGQLVYGVVSDRFGRRNTLLFGIGLYAVGAIVSASAPTFAVLIAGRVVWGLGAASPAVLRPAIARDLYEGDRMARVVTIFTAVFLLGPIFVPLIGEGLLTVGSWPIVYFAGVVVAAAAFGWTLQFGETHPVERRRPLAFGPLWRASRLVVTTRWTMMHILAQTLVQGAFFVYLGSSQPILDEIYGRDDQFARFFAAAGVVMAIALLVNQWLIARIGARPVVVGAVGALVVTGLVGTTLVVASGGVPSVWTWFAWAVVANALSTVISALCSALALDPMGEVAGTASAVLGFLTLGGGAALAAVVDARIDGTVTPMVVASLLYGSLAAACILFAGPRPGRAVPGSLRPDA